MTAQRNKVAYLTGSSRGIGAALKESLVDAGFHVVGLSRSEEKNTPNFTAIQLDLNDLNAVQRFKFEIKADQILLINNAGMIGTIAPVGTVDNQTIQGVMTVNSIAPQILMNTFLKTYVGSTNSGHIINISSGAGKYPIDAWATYCASKAAIDLFSETTRTELESRGQSNWFVHSIAPGVVDTAMQGEIRNSDPKLFQSHEKFIALKANQELASPITVAQKIMQVIESPTSFEKTLISVRDF